MNATTLARPGGPRLAEVLLRTQSDERLATLAGEGSQQAFDEMVRRHRTALVAYAGRIAPPDRADDVVQESMVKAFLALRRGDRPELPKAWMFKIVRNTALNDQRDWRQFEHLDENYDGVEQPPEAAERRRQLKQLVVALSDLPEAQRKAIVQRELEGKGHDEIAEDLSVSPGAVRQLIFRARGTLRAGLGALIPMQLLRWVALAGADPSAPAAAAGAGIGLGAAKVGLGAVLATSAVVVGAQVGSDIKKNDAAKPATPTEQSATVQGSEATGESQAANTPGASSRRNQQQPAAAKGKGLEKVANAQVRQLAPAPLRRLNPPPPNQPPRRPGGQQSGTQSGPGGTTTYPPPPNGGQHHQPPPGGTSGTGTLPPPPQP